MCRFHRGEDMIITDNLVDLVLKLLQVPKIKEAIQRICSEGGTTRGVESSPSRTTQSSYGSGSVSFSYAERESKRKNDELVEELESLRSKLSSSQLQLQKENEKNAKLEETKKTLAKQFEDEVKERKKVEARNNELTTALATSKDETQKKAAEVKKLSDELQNWKNALGKAMEAFNAFLSLSENDRESLENTFRVEELTSFIASAAKWENIEAIWNYARYEFNQGRLASREKLLCILRFCLDVHNNAFYSEPRYKWQEIEEGDEFDGELYDKTPDSRTSGAIQQVLLPGIVSADDSEVIVKKSLTKV